MPKASTDEVLAGYRQLGPGERLKIFKPWVYTMDWDGSRAVWVALRQPADLAELVPTCGPSTRDTRPAPESPLSVAEPGSRPSAPRPSPIALSASRRGTLAA